MSGRGLRQSRSNPRNARRNERKCGEGLIRALRREDPEEWARRGRVAEEARKEQGRG